MESMLALILQQGSDEGFGALFAGSYFVMCCCYLIVIVVLVAGMWKMFVKAGKPGWAAIIPLYNIWVMLEIVGRPGWWLILFFIPLVNFVVLAIVSIELAHSFGRGIGFGIGVFLFPFIFYLILGFGDAQYVGPGAGKAF